MFKLTLRSIVSAAAMSAVLAVLLLPLCGGLFAAHLCPMEMAPMADHGDACQGPAGPGVKRQAMDCCVAPQAGSPPVLTAATLQVATAPIAQPVALAALPVASIAAPRFANTLPPRSDLLSLHSSLLL